MRSTRYPPALFNGKATTYGPNPSHGKSKLALVLHTTETVGMPGFNHGDTAPHLTYDPRTRSWEQWASLDRYVGTMKGHSSGHWNCQAIQVEILAYSDGSVAPGNGWWVGDLLDHHYQDLAHLYQWLMQEQWVGLDLTPTPDGGWRYGTGSPHRMTAAQYDAFSGLTAHGAVPGNTHWDTGVLDLEYVWLLATDGNTGPPPGPGPGPGEDEPMWPMYLTDGYDSPTGQGRTAWRSNVVVLQGMVNDAGGNITEDGKLGPGTCAAVQAITGEPCTDRVTGKHANLLRRAAGGGSGPHDHPHSHSFQGQTATSG